MRNLILTDMGIVKCSLKEYNLYVENEQLLADLHGLLNDLGVKIEYNEVVRLVDKLKEGKDGFGKPKDTIPGQ